MKFLEAVRYLKRNGYEVKPTDVDTDRGRYYDVTYNERRASTLMLPLEVIKRAKETKAILGQERGANVFPLYS